MKTLVSFLSLAVAGAGAAAAPVQINSTPDKPAQLYVERSERLQTFDWNAVAVTFYAPGGIEDGSGLFNNRWRQTFGWTNQGGGMMQMTNDWQDEVFNYWGAYGGETGYAMSLYEWPASSWPELPSGSGSYFWTNVWDDGGTQGDYEEYPVLPPPDLINEISDVAETEYQDAYTQFYPDGRGAEWSGDKHYQRRYQQEWRLRTGGRAGSQRKSLYRISATAEAWRLVKQAEFGTVLDLGYTTNLGVINPATTPIKIGSLGKVGSDGILWVALADNTTNDVTPKVEGHPFYTFTVGQQNLRLDLRSVSFNGMGLKRDQDGTAYATPHWTNGVAGLAGPVQSHPTLYVSGSRVGTSNTFEVRGGGGFEVIVKGEASGGETSFTLWGTNTPNGTALLAPTIADAALTTNKVDCYNPMSIKWSYAAQQTNQPLEYLQAGVSTNQVYVSLKTPITHNLFHTVVHVACSEPGATTEQTAVENTWGQFTGPNVQTWDGVELYYWQTTAAQPSLQNLPGDTFGLLQKRTGHCAAWAKLLIDAFRVNGVTGVQLLELKPGYAETEGFPPSLLVKKWTFPSSASLPASYLPFTNTRADTLEAEGVAGQNHNDPPSVFENHFIVRYILDETSFSYFDPSYGKGPWTALEAWENASIDGFQRFLMINGILVQGTKKNTSGLEVLQSTPAY